MSDIRRILVIASIASIGLVAGCSESSPKTAQTSTPRKRVIILCTGNSCRSQMAEALWRKHGGDQWEVVSAGIKPKGEIFPPAIQVMAEKGIDISKQKPKSVDAFVNQDFDLVITVCDNAEKNCPNFARAKQHLHWPFEDPPKAAGGIEGQTRVCRRVRDEIDVRIVAFLSPEAHAASH